MTTNPRSKKKIGKEELRFIIENWDKMSTVALGLKLNVDHTTVIHWAKKLREEGFNLPRNIGLMNQQKVAIRELKDEYGLSPANPQK
jgi:transposase